MGRQLSLPLPPLFPLLDECNSDLSPGESLKCGSRLLFRQCSRESKVAYFHIQAFINEYVLWLDIPVKDVSFMRKFNGAEKVVKEVDYHILGELESLGLVEYVNKACPHVIHNDINCYGAFLLFYTEVVNLSDVVTAKLSELSQNLYLSYQLDRHVLAL